MSRRLSNEKNHSAGYILADRGTELTPVNPLPEPCPGRASARRAYHACMPVSLVSAQVGGRLKIHPFIMVSFSTKAGSYGLSQQSVVFQFSSQYRSKA